MSIKHLIAAVVAVSAAVSASAVQLGEAPTENAFANTVSAKTRAEVMAEFVQAKADGTYLNSEVQAQASANHPTSDRSRAEVVTELKKAKADGSYVDSEASAALQLNHMNRRKGS